MREVFQLHVYLKFLTHDLLIFGLVLHAMHVSSILSM
nr:MAG TPA: hypothetical protein [Caudoviricetes sp.]